jgi:hypothetical protein
MSGMLNFQSYRPRIVAMTRLITRTIVFGIQGVSKRPIRQREWLRNIRQSPRGCCAAVFNVSRASPRVHF